MDYLVCALLDIESEYFLKYNQRCMHTWRIKPKSQREEQCHQRGFVIPAAIEVRRSQY